MEVLIIRHAPAEELSDAHTSDADRALTSKGRKLFGEFTQRMAKAVDVPDLVLFSPLVRTRQTAEIFCDVVGIPTNRMRAETRLQPGMSVNQLAELLGELPEQRIAVIGHNPDVSYCASQLIGGGNIDFKKGSAACIDFLGSVRPGMGRLNWFISPKLVVND